MINLDFMPSRQLAIYAAKLFLTRSLAVLIMLVMVLMMLDLLGESGKILKVPGNGEAELWRYVSLRVPILISRFLPFSVLLGALIAFVGLNQNSEVTAMKASGLMTRLSLAWSRDSAEKFYVQDRMREVGRELWTWLADGAHVYVCGDAKRMAKDVERALVDITAQFGARSTDEAIAFVADLKKKGRYQQDVY